MKYQLIDTVAASLYHFLGHKLLEQEAFTIVTKGQTTPQGVDMSKLYPVVDKSIVDVEGYVWQSSVHNWNYESGVATSPQPTVANGVYVNGAFKATNDAAYAHTIDYNNGRVIFSNPVSTDTLIQADFTYGELSLIHSDSLPMLVNNDKPEFNSSLINYTLAADPASIYIPCILMELDSAGDEPFQMGGTNSIHPTFKFTIMGTTQQYVDRVADLFISQEKKALCLVNAENWPLFMGTAGISSSYSYLNTVNRKIQIATLESVKYNRFLDRSELQKQPQVFAGIVRIEIFAVRN